MNGYKEIKRDVVWIIVFIILLTLIFGFFKIGWDSTDGDKRSGLGLHTDNLTGCQYLSSPRGGLVPLNNEATRKAMRAPCPSKDPTNEQ